MEPGKSGDKVAVAISIFLSWALADHQRIVAGFHKQVSSGTEGHNLIPRPFSLGHRVPYIPAIASSMLSGAGAYSSGSMVYPARPWLRLRTAVE